MSAALVAIALSLLGACGDDAPDRADAAPDAIVTPFEPLAPEAPVTAALPRMLPCPAGWTARTRDDGITYCEPFPEGALDCAPGTMQLPGDAICSPIGAECPEVGEFAMDLPSGPTVYVREDASGAGTRADPIGSISGALALVEDGGVIALARGHYRDHLEIDRDVTIVGACARETVVEADGDAPVVRIASEHRVEIANVRLRTAAAELAEVRGGTLAATDVWFGPGNRAVLAVGGELDLERVSFRDLFDSLRPSIAIDAVEAQVSMHDVAITHVPSAAFRLVQGCEVDLARVAVVSEPDRPMHQVAFVIDLAGEIDARELALIGLDGGIALGPGSTRIRDLYVDALRRESAIAVGAGANLTLERATVLRSPGITSIFFDGSSIYRDVAVLDGFPDAESVDHGAVLAATAGASLEVERVAISSVVGSGISISDEARLTGQDLTIHAIRGQALVQEGIGLAVTGADVALERLHVDRTESAGVLIADASTARVTDLVIDESGVGGSRAVALGVSGGSTLELTRAALAFDRTIAFVAAGAGTRVDATDLAIRDSMPSELDGDHGRGIECADGASVAIERALVERAHDHAIVVSSRSRLSARELTIEGAAARACTTDDCARHPAGIGIGVHGSMLELDRFAVREAVLCGVHVGADAQLAIGSGVIADNAVGVCAPSADAVSFFDAVSFDGNDHNLDVVELPVPSPLASLADVLP